MPLSLGSSNPRKGITGLLYPGGEGIIFFRKVGKLPTFRRIAIPSRLVKRISWYTRSHIPENLKLEHHR